MTVASAVRELTGLDRSALDTNPPRRRLRACESVHFAPTMGAPANWLEGEYTTRAMTLWPRLDRRRLRRCHDDPNRIAVLVSDRTALPYESIVKLLVEDETVETELASGCASDAGDWRLCCSGAEGRTDYRVATRPWRSAGRNDRLARTRTRPGR